MYVDFTYFTSELCSKLNTSFHAHYFCYVLMNTKYPLFSTAMAQIWNKMNYEFVCSMHDNSIHQMALPNQCLVEFALVGIL